MALIEIDGLPFLIMVIFHGYVSHNQMVFYTIQSTGDDHNPGESTEVLRVLQLRRFFGIKPDFRQKW